MSRLEQTAITKGLNFEDDTINDLINKSNIKKSNSLFRPKST